MDFLTPIFAAVGVAAAAVPVILHMLRRAPTQDMPFSIVRFLKPSRPKLTKRSTIEHWPLMLLRMLALVLIGLAFARPFLRQVVPFDLDSDLVQSVTLLVDRSASMRRDGVREQVLQHIRDVVDELEAADLLSVVTFSDTSATLVSPEQWAASTAEERAAIVEEILDSYEPDWMATDTGTAMRIAAENLVQENRQRQNIQRRRLVLVTDFQRGSDLNELKRGDWPAGVEVELRTVAAGKRGNVGVTFQQDRRADRTRVRIFSAGDSVQQEFSLQPFDADGAAVGEAIPVTVAPGQRRSLLLPTADLPAGRVVAGVELKGDDHPFDNVIDLPEIDNPVVRVAHIGPAALNDPESMRYYLQRVLDGNVERDVRLIDLKGDGDVLLPVPGDVRLVVATDVVPDGLLDSLSAFFGRSGTLLMAPPTTDAVMSLKKFLPVHFAVQEADVRDYAMLGQIDFDHPLFSVFSDARFSDFSTIRFRHYRNLVFSEEDRQDGDWTIISKFDTGLPAIAEVRVGDSGRLLLFASGWHPGDSQLALSTRFAPLLTRVLSLASPSQKNQIIQTVGDVVRPAELVSSDQWTVTLPDGSRLSWDDDPQEDAAAAAAGLLPSAGTVARTIESTGASVSISKEERAAETVVTLKQPGRYMVTGQTEDGEQRVSLIAGLATSESNTEMLPIGQLQVLGIGVEAPADPQSETSPLADPEQPLGQLSAGELERKQKWWRWLLLAGLGCLAAESLWASAIQRRQVPDA
ncbi:MAG: BatA domain-containing protein [Fuerstiella sp.]